MRQGDGEFLLPPLTQTLTSCSPSMPYSASDDDVEEVRSAETTRVTDAPNAPKLNGTDQQFSRCHRKRPPQSSQRTERESFRVALASAHEDEAMYVQSKVNVNTPLNAPIRTRSSSASALAHKTTAVALERVPRRRHMSVHEKSLQGFHRGDERESPSHNETQTSLDRRRREARAASCGQGDRKPKSMLSKHPISLDDDDGDSVDAAESNEKEPAVTTRRRGLPARRASTQVPSSSCTITRSRRATEVLEVAEEVKDLPNLEATYTGPTHLIFMYPRGNSRGKITVTAEERERLRQRKYLSDSLIDFYLRYLETDDLDRRDPNLRISTKFFSSFFFRVLRRAKPIDYAGVKGWTKNIDLFNTDVVVVPICDSHHWSLIIVVNLKQLGTLLENDDTKLRPENPKIVYLDSLDTKRGNEFGETIRRYLVEEWLNRKQSEEITDELRREMFTRFKKIMPTLRPTAPMQNNEYDCGLYLLNSLVMFLGNTDNSMEKILKGCDVEDMYSPAEIQKLREEIVSLMDSFEAEWKLENTDPLDVAKNEPTNVTAEGESLKATGESGQSSPEAISPSMRDNTQDTKPSPTEEIEEGIDSNTQRAALYSPISHNDSEESKLCICGSDTVHPQPETETYHDFKADTMDVDSIRNPDSPILNRGSLMEDVGKVASPSGLTEASPGTPLRVGGMDNGEGEELRINIGRYVVEAKGAAEEDDCHEDGLGKATSNDPTILSDDDKSTRRIDRQLNHATGRVKKRAFSESLPDHGAELDGQDEEPLGYGGMKVLPRSSPRAPTALRTDSRATSLKTDNTGVSGVEGLSRRKSRGGCTARRLAPPEQCSVETAGRERGAAGQPVSGSCSDSGSDDRSSGEDVDENNLTRE